MKVIISLLYFSLLSFSTNSFAFTLNNTAALVFNHDEVTVNVANITCNNIGIDTTELKSIVVDAVDQYWNRSPTSRLKLRAGSVTTVSSAFGTDSICLAPTGECEPNPTVSVAHDIMITCNSNTTNFTSTAILAVTVPNNIQGKNIIGSLIMLNDRSGTQFATKSRAEKASIIAHELGHAFGLGHSPVVDSLMYYATIDMRKSLGSDDIDGISYLYPKTQPISCGSIDTKNTNSKNNPNSWLGLFIGFFAVFVIAKTQSRYLKLRPRA